MRVPGALRVSERLCVCLCVPCSFIVGVCFIFYFLLCIHLFWSLHTFIVHCCRANRNERRLCYLNRIKLTARIYAIEYMDLNVHKPLWLDESVDSRCKRLKRVWNIGDFVRIWLNGNFTWTWHCLHWMHCHITHETVGANETAKAESERERDKHSHTHKL